MSGDWALAPGLETHNGAMLAEHNGFVAELAASITAAGMQPVAVGGSDAHLLGYVGTDLHVSPRVDAGGILDNLRLGNTETGGAHGGRGRLLVEVYGSIANHWIGMLGMQRNDFTGRHVRRRESALPCLPFHSFPASLRCA